MLDLADITDVEPSVKLDQLGSGQLRDLPGHQDQIDALARFAHTPIQQVHRGRKAIARRHALDRAPHDRQQHFDAFGGILARLRSQIGDLSLRSAGGIAALCPVSSSSR
jgi:hypothetical protein